jgi:hypothetical protein
VVECLASKCEALSSNPTKKKKQKKKLHNIERFDGSNGRQGVGFCLRLSVFSDNFGTTSYVVLGKLFDHTVPIYSILLFYYFHRIIFNT